MDVKPIIFSAPMVKALLSGQKTQTRRVLKPQPYPLEGRPGFWNASGAVGGHICTSDRDLLDLHHKPEAGDILWVRESWRTGGSMDSFKPSLLPKTAAIVFEADGFPAPSWRGKLRPSIYLPRWASRITLVVTDVRVQRLQEISEDDAVAEGLEWYDGGHKPWRDAGWQCYPVPTPGNVGLSSKEAVFAYSTLWNEINGPGAWDANPWVVAYTFRPIVANVDRYLEKVAAR